MWSPTSKIERSQFQRNFKIARLSCFSRVSIWNRKFIPGMESSCNDESRKGEWNNFPQNEEKSKKASTRENLIAHQNIVRDLKHLLQNCRNHGLETEEYAEELFWLQHQVKEMQENAACRVSLEAAQNKALTFQLKETLKVVSWVVLEMNLN